MNIKDEFMGLLAAVFIAALLATFFGFALKGIVTMALVIVLISSMRSRPSYPRWTSFDNLHTLKPIR